MTEPRSELPELDLVLPGTWWSVDLGDETSAARSVRAAVERLVGPRDEFARARAELRSRLTELVATARRADAANLYIALELTDRLAVPMTLTVYWPPETVLGARPSTPSTVIELVREALDSTPSAAAYGDEVVEDLGSTSTLRRTTVVHSAADGDMPAVEMLIVDYWLAVPGTQRVVLLTFSTPFVQARAQLLELFRTMVELIRFTDAPAAVSPAGATGP